MFLFSEGLFPKPNRITDTKDKDYHGNFAKYGISMGFNRLHQSFVRKASILRRFYANDQWILDEDIEAFLKDESGGETGRIKVAFNIVRPIVEQYRGNAINMNMNASAQSTSGKVKTRRDKALAEKLFYSRTVAEFRSPVMQEALRNSYDVGGDDEETNGIFENAYVDQLQIQIDKLLQYNSDLNEFVRMQSPLAEDLALSGLCVTEGFEHGGHLRWEWFKSNLFFWDRSAYKKDLTDAQFMGRLDMVDATTVFERWPNMLREDKINLEKYTNDIYQGRQNSNGVNEYIHNHEYGGYTDGSLQIPQYKVYWRDVERYKYGWVEDEQGYPILTKIDYIPEGEDEAKYTESDCIDPPETVRSRRLFFKNGVWSKTTYRDVDVLRYCIIIPHEVFMSTAEKQKRKKVSDIILEYGMAPHQEDDFDAVDNIKFPFKVGIWSYQEGEVLSPTDSIINPQRFINRILSVQESQINNSGGAGIVIDEHATHGTNQDEHDIARKVKAGQPVLINTKGKGVPNSVGKYDATPQGGTYQLSALVNEMYTFTQQMTGVNDPLQGQSTGSGQLVGVTELMIQKGSLVQEPFYYALADTFLQMYQHIATVGKDIYLDNERELVNIVGPDGYDVFQLSQELRNEHFRTFIKRENTEDQLTSIANQEVMMFFQLGLLTEKDFAELYGQGNPKAVIRQLRATAIAKIQADKMAAEQMTAEGEQLEGQQQGAIDEVNAREDKARLAESADKMADRNAKSSDVMNQVTGSLMSSRQKGG